MENCVPIIKQLPIFLGDFHCLHLMNNENLELKNSKKYSRGKSVF